jgi:pyridoxamine 5'-phosphate oxidase-like protein
MAKVFDGIDERLAAWIAAQRLFFVATAPSAGGHVNVSPKGPIETLSVVGPDRVAYLDRIGSGAETAAHLRDDGRITIMLCALEGPPRIVRLHGRGSLVAAGDPGFAQRLAETGLEAVDLPEVRRAVVDVAVQRVSDSCGYGVPLMSFEGHRPQTARWAETKLRKEGPGALARYVEAKNARSIDGLPAFDG